MSKIPKQKNIPEEEEEDSDLIINNDEFWAENEQKINNIKLLQKKNYENENKPKNIKNLQIKSDYMMNSNLNNNLTEENQIGQKDPHLDNKNPNRNGNSNALEYEKSDEKNNEQKILSFNTNNINTYNDEKTIFSKITEDLYLDNLTNLNQRKNVVDLDKRKEDNYNKLTVENYLFTCADKENSKNSKIISDFIERKTKEERCKKIGIEIEKNGKNSQFERFKRLSSDHKKIKRPKNARSPEQFMGDQKFFEERHKNYIKNLMKKHEDEINMMLQDRPTINKNSERITNMNKENNKSVYLKLYEEYNIKKKNREENDKKYNALNDINLNLIGNQKLNKETILENANRLHKEYEKKKNTINENEIKQLEDIKNLSTISLVNKNSNYIISKKIISLYKKEFKSLFVKNVSDNFEIKFIDYLVFIYKLGLTEKNYNQLLNENNSMKNLLINNTENNFDSTGTEQNKDKNIESNRIIFPKNNEEEVIKDKVRTSRRIVKKKTFSKSRSVGKKIFESDLELKLAKESWKIITNNKIFNDGALGPSYRVLLFFLSLCGIYNDGVNNFFLMKKEFPFLLKDNSNLLDGISANHIYKYFSNYRNSLINNINKNFKPVKKIWQLKDIDLNNGNLAKGSKSFINNNNGNKKIFLERNSRRIVISDNNLFSQSCKKLNNLNKNNTVNNVSNNEPKIDKKIYIKNNIKNYLINRTKKNTFSSRSNKIKEDENIEKNLDNILEKKIRKIKIKNKSNIKVINGDNTEVKKNKKVLKMNKIDINNNLHENNNKTKEPIKNISKHQKEKQSSVSNYIFNEECRIRDDIESNSNFNNFDENENNINKNASDNLDEYNSYNENSINNGSNLNVNKSSIKAEESSSKTSNNIKKKKNKFVFKIKIKDEMIKLDINKDEDIDLKINQFCKENNLDEEDKNQILEVVKSKLKK